MDALELLELRRGLLDFANSVKNLNELQSIGEVVDILFKYYEDAKLNQEIDQAKYQLGGDR